MQSTLQPPPWPSLLRHLSTVQPALLGCLPKQTKTLAPRGTAPHHPTHPRLPVQCASWPLKLQVFGQTQERVPTILEVGETSLMSITPGFTDPGGAWPDLRDQSVLKFKVRVTVSLPHSSQGSFCPFISQQIFCKHTAICLQEAFAPGDRSKGKQSK